MKNVLTILFTIALLALPAPAAAEGEGARPAGISGRIRCAGRISLRNLNGEM